MKGIVLSVLLAISACGLPLAATAQDTTSAGARIRKADIQARLQELRARIEQVKYQKLKTELGMDDETATKFFAIYKPAEKEIQDIVKERNEEMQKLRLLTNGAKSDADVDPEMQKIKDLNKQIVDRAQKLDNDLKPVLSPRQRAKLLEFEHDFQQSVARTRQPAAGANPKVKALRKQLRQARIEQWLLKHPNALKGLR